jgi:hypothetical protein
MATQEGDYKIEAMLEEPRELRGCGKPAVHGIAEIDRKAYLFMSCFQKVTGGRRCPDW